MLSQQTVAIGCVESFGQTTNNFNKKLDKIQPDFLLTATWTRNFKQDIGEQQINIL